MDASAPVTAQRPRQVETAVSIMAVNTVILNFPRTAIVFIGVVSGHIPNEDAIFKVIDEFVIWGFSLGFLALIWFGANWARWLNLVLAIFNFGLMAIRAVKLADEHRLAVIYPIAYVLLESIALYLLFISPGRFWFNRANAGSAA